MARATLTVAGRRYDLPCREGEQDHLESLGRVIDAKAIQAANGLGGINESRQLLLAALLLADELDDARHGGPAPEHPAPRDPALAALAARIEAIADALEKAAAPA